jgi:hypothetical protein
LGELLAQSEPRSVDFCQELPGIQAAVLDDGELEAGLSARSWVSGFWYGGSAALPQDVTATYAAAWLPNGIYFYMRVVDPRAAAGSTVSAHCGPGVEFYVDADGRYSAPPLYDDPGSTHVLVAAPMAGGPPPLAQKSRGIGPLGLWAGAFGGRRVEDAYVIEAVLTAADLDLAEWSLGPGSSVGIDFALNVASGTLPSLAELDCSGRLGQSVLQAAPEPCDCTGYDEARCLAEDCRAPWLNVLAFCNPTLLP